MLAVDSVLYFQVQCSICRPIEKILTFQVVEMSLMSRDCHLFYKDDVRYGL